jgi:hypothetical protein
MMQRIRSIAASQALSEGGLPRIEKDPGSLGYARDDTKIRRHNENEMPESKLLLGALAELAGCAGEEIARDE